MSAYYNVAKDLGIDKMNRFPFTYMCDFIRRIIDTKYENMSRSDVSKEFRNISDDELYKLGLVGFIECEMTTLPDQIYNVMKNLESIESKPFNHIHEDCVNFVKEHQGEE